MVHRLLLGGVWLVAGAATLLVGAALLAGGVGLAFQLSGGELGEVQRATWWAVARGIGRGALLPVLVWTVAGWLLASAWRPDWEATWRGCGLGVPAVALLGFPPAAALTFDIWTPRTPWDYLATWLLVSGAVSVALLAPRRLLRILAPGALAPGARGETSGPAGG